MTWGLDTSVTVRLLVGEPTGQAAAARQALESTKDGVAVSDLVVGETYFALRYHYRVPHAAAITALKALLDDPRVHSTGVARDTLRAMGSRDTAPGLMDRLIHGDYQRAGAQLLTLDRDAARLHGSRLLKD